MVLLTLVNVKMFESVAAQTFHFRAQTLTFVRLQTAVVVGCAAKGQQI
tara:strand:- start:197 stop:340 length:144 start_codon:yes stop_codon:yes gene_type:complete